MKIMRFIEKTWVWCRRGDEKANFPSARLLSNSQITEVSLFLSFLTQLTEWTSALSLDTKWTANKLELLEMFSSKSGNE
jgi:hypothetical protein